MWPSVRECFCFWVFVWVFPLHCPFRHPLTCHLLAQSDVALHRTMRAKIHWTRAVETVESGRYKVQQHRGVRPLSNRREGKIQKAIMYVLSQRRFSTVRPGRTVPPARLYMMLNSSGRKFGLLFFFWPGGRQAESLIDMAISWAVNCPGWGGVTSSTTLESVLNFPLAARGQVREYHAGLIPCRGMGSRQSRHLEQRCRATEPWTWYVCSIDVGTTMRGREGRCGRRGPRRSPKPDEAGRAGVRRQGNATEGRPMRDAPSYTRGLARRGRRRDGGTPGSTSCEVWRLCGMVALHGLAKEKWVVCCCLVCCGCAFHVGIVILFRVA